MTLLATERWVLFAAVADPPPAQENHISEQSKPSAEEANGGEVYNPPENDNVPVVEEEVHVAEVVDEVQGDSQMAAESNIIVEDVPKKSYASIVSSHGQSNWRPISFSFAFQ